MASIHHPWREGQEWRRCDPLTGVFAIPAEALAQGQSEGKDRSFALGALQNSGMGFTGGWGSGAPVRTDTEQQRWGRFIRSTAQFRHWIRRGWPARPHLARGASEAKAGRYHLYISHALPWAHRTAISAASRVSRPDALGTPGGALADGRTGLGTFRSRRRVIAIPIQHAKGVARRSTQRRSRLQRFASRCTLLWDKETGRSVNNGILGNHPPDVQQCLFNEHRR